MDLDKKLKDITRARKRLNEEQGRVARNNARRAMMKALKEARAALDKEFPVIRGKAKPRRKTPAKPPRNWIRVTFEVFTGGSDKNRFVAECAAAGVRLRHYPARGYGQRKRNARGKMETDKTKHLYAPLWAVAAYGQGKNLKLVAKSRSEQKIVMAAWRLQHVTG